MRVKSPKLVITFASLSDAMTMQKEANERGIAGRIIPVPTEISVGCGMAWCAEEADRETLADQLNLHGIVYEGIYEAMLF